MRRHGFHKFLRMCGERALFHYLDCTRVQFVSKKSADERDGWIAIGRTRGSKRGREGSVGREEEEEREREKGRLESSKDHDERRRRNDEGTRRSAHYRAGRSAVGLAHYNFYDWSFGSLGALTRMPTCKGRITVTAETGLSAKVSVAFKSGESARYRRSELICRYGTLLWTLEILRKRDGQWSVIRKRTIVLTDWIHCEIPCAWKYIQLIFLSQVSVLQQTVSWRFDELSF